MAVGDAYVFPGFLTPVLTQLSFQSHRLLLLHASTEVRGKNMPQRKFASTGDGTHNHQVMSRPIQRFRRTHAYLPFHIYLSDISHFSFLLHAASETGPIQFNSKITGYEFTLFLLNKGHIYSKYL